MSLETRVFVAVGNVSLDKADNGYSPGGPVLYSTLAARRNGWKPIAVTSFGPDFYQAQPPLDGIIVLTEGSRPNHIFAGAHHIVMNTIPTREIDPTGAGDVFAAMFAMAYREKGPGGRAITDALSWAQIGGSYLASQGMKGLIV